jgi:hypothetical protein
MLLTHLIGDAERDGVDIALLFAPTGLSSAFSGRGET